MKKIEFVGTRFELENGYYVDVVPGNDESGALVYDFILYHSFFDVNMSMFSLLADECPSDMWEDIIAGSKDKYITMLDILIESKKHDEECEVEELIECVSVCSSIRFDLKDDFFVYAVSFYSGENEMYDNYYLGHKACHVLVWLFKSPFLGGDTYLMKELVVHMVDDDCLKTYTQKYLG